MVPQSDYNHILPIPNCLIYDNNDDYDDNYDLPFITFLVGNVKLKTVVSAF